MKVATWINFIKNLIVVICWTKTVLCNHPCPTQCVCEPAETPRGAIAVSCVGLGIKKLPVELDSIVNLRSVNLSQNGFTEIPQGLHSSIATVDLRHNKITAIESEGLNSLYNIEELYLDHNHVSSIRSEDFGYAGTEDEALPYLRKLGLSHNRIKTFEEAPFRSLQSLKALTLSYNELVKISGDLFRGMTVLELIDLSHNHITTIQKGTFKNLPALKYVYLRWNEISEYPVELPMLDWLDLSHNSIQYIDEDQKEDVYPVEMLNLAHNPLICDCKTRWLKELYDRREYVLKYINIPTWEFIPTCAAPPNLAGDTWDMLGDDVFLCESEDENDDEFIDDLGTLMHKDPDVDDLKNLATRDKNKGENVHDYIVNVMASVTNVEGSSATVKWVLDDPDGLCKKLYIQYYQSGSKDTTLLIAPISTRVTSYTIHHLEPDTQYRACVLPATSKSEIPSSILSPVQCVQFVTGTLEQNPEHKSTDDTKNNLKWRIPDSDEITGYAKLIGFSFVVSVIITGACLFVFEIVVYCYRLFSEKDDRTSQNTVVKSHTD